MRALRTFCLACLLGMLGLLTAPGLAVAQQQAESVSSPVVVELFTSQGCSSCPPADALLFDLAGRSEVIALALHVDYWDYLGWQDEFALPEHAERQRAYARNQGQSMIYTPQMVINGQHAIVGTKPMKVMDLVESHRAAANYVTLGLRREGSVVVIEAPAVRMNRPMQVILLRYVPRSEVEVTRGENRGRTLSYANVVQHWEDLASWDGAAPLDLRADAPGDLPVVVLVQAEGTGPILAAAELR